MRAACREWVDCPGLEAAVLGRPMRHHPPTLQTLILRASPSSLEAEAWVSRLLRRWGPRWRGEDETT